MTYRVILTAPAQRGWNRLPDKVRHAVAEFLQGPLADDPQRVGKRLTGELEGRHSARRGEYRVIYTIREVEVEVEVGHRRDVDRR